MSQSDDHPKEIAPAESHEAAAHGDSGHSDHEHFDMHLGLYLGVGGFLLFATVVTVWLSFVDFGSHAANWIVAMAVATLKVGFVAAIFMHLKGEKKTIWQFLLFTMLFVTGLFLLSLFHYMDPIFGTNYSTH